MDPHTTADYLLNIALLAGDPDVFHIMYCNTRDLKEIVRKNNHFKNVNDSDLSILARGLGALKSAQVQPAQIGEKETFSVRAKDNVYDFIVRLKHHSINEINYIKTIHSANPQTPAGIKMLTGASNIPYDTNASIILNWYLSLTKNRSIAKDQRITVLALIGLYRASNTGLFYIYDYIVNGTPFTTGQLTNCFGAVREAGCADNFKKLMGLVGEPSIRHFIPNFNQDIYGKVNADFSNSGI